MAGTVEVVRGQWSASRWLHVRPPRIAQGLALLALMLHLVLWGFAAPFGNAPFAGAALMAVGLGWMLWAAWMFRQAATTIRPTAAPSILVDEGPYRYGRNPMYLGMTVAMLGLALILGVPFMALAGAVFAVIVHRLHIPFEEAQLRRTFGGWYSDYAATVRRWL
jgi:protein-S-isoprenylcysteine O-methyltransferase Ste14